MTLETIEKFFNSIDDVMKMYNKDKYHISFFGGEPLLNWDLIKEVLPRFNKDPRCHSTVVITNGLLLDQEKFEYLQQNRCGISMSFDGIWNEHNRPLANGKSSFNHYINNKEFYSKFIRGSKVMISPKNFRTMTENFEFFINEMKFYKPDFSLVRDDIYTKEDLKIFDYEVKRLADKVIEYNLNGIQCGVGLFDLYILDLIFGKKQGKRPFGCFAGCGGAVFATDGKYYPCERFRSESPEYQFPIYDANTNTINKENYEFLMQPKVSNPQEFPECKKCDLYQFCNSGCTHSQLKNGKWKRSKPVDSVCQLLRMSYREAMRVFSSLKHLDHYRNLLKNSINNVN